MKKLIFSTVIFGSLGFLIAGCTSTFMATKDGKGYHLGSSSNAAFEMFCASGDLKKILAGTTFDAKLSENLYQYNCGTERSSDKVKQVFASMTPAQRKELRQSFKNNGYDINIMRC